jgi:pimeloyl-ACP methyl ester carboxylesterase
MHETELGGLAVLAGRWPLNPRLPLLLFVHGAGGSRLLWLAQVRALTEVANPVALDLPGHGRSAGPGRSDVAGYAAAVREVIHGSGLPHAVLCGLSMGGAIVQQLLLDVEGDGIRGGVLISTGARLRVSPAIFEAIDRDYPAYLRLMGEWLAAPGTPAAVRDAVVTQAAACPATVTRSDFDACEGFDARERLSRIACPVLVIQAEQDLLTPPPYGRFLADKIPDATLVMVPEAGHIVPVEQPHAVNQAIGDFIRGLRLPGCGS